MTKKNEYYVKESFKIDLNNPESMREAMGEVAAIAQLSGYINGRNQEGYEAGFKKGLRTGILIASGLGGIIVGAMAAIITKGKK